MTYSFVNPATHGSLRVSGKHAKYLELLKDHENNLKNYPSLLSAFSITVTASRKLFFYFQISSQSTTNNNHLQPSANDLATSFTGKVDKISAQFNETIKKTLTCVDTATSLETWTLEMMIQDGGAYRRVSMFLLCQQSWLPFQLLCTVHMV